MIKKEAAWGSDVLRYQPSCLQGYDGSEPLEQQFSSQACGVQRQLSSPGSCQYRQTPTGSLVDSGLFLKGFCRGQGKFRSNRFMRGEKKGGGGGGL